MVAAMCSRSLETCAPILLALAKKYPAVGFDQIETELRAYSVVQTDHGACLLTRNAGNRVAVAEHDDAAIVSVDPVPFFLFAEERSKANFNRNAAVGRPGRTDSAEFILGMSTKGGRELAKLDFEPGCHDPEINLTRLQRAGFACSVPETVHPDPQTGDSIVAYLQRLEADAAKTAFCILEDSIWEELVNCCKKDPELIKTFAVPVVNRKDQPLKDFL